MLQGFAQRVAPRLAAKGKLIQIENWDIGYGLSPYYSQRLNVIGRIRRNLFSSAKEPFEITWLLGQKFYVCPTDEISKVLYFTGLYEPNVSVFLDRVLKPGMTFIDVGANIGLFSIFASKKVGIEGRVVAIEPSSREIENFEKNRRLNKCENILLKKIGLSDFDGSGELKVATRDHSGHNTLGDFAYAETKMEKTETVKIQKLDTVVKESEITSIDMIKMDIEGSELRALQGALESLKNFEPIIVLELSDLTLNKQGTDSKAIVKFMEGLYYSLHFLDKQNAVAIPKYKSDQFDFF